MDDDFKLESSQNSYYPEIEKAVSDICLIWFGSVQSWFQWMWHWFFGDDEVKEDFEYLCTAFIVLGGNGFHNLHNLES